MSTITCFAKWGHMLKSFFLPVKLFFLLSFSLLHSATIIFDLDGVLLDKSKMQAAWHIGISHFIGWHSPFQLEKQLFTFLNRIEPRKSETVKITYKNMLLPQIMCDWQSGIKTSNEIHELIDKQLALSKDHHVIGKMAHFMFNPHMLSKVMYPVKKGIKLLKKCYHQRDGKGNRLHKIYILSNWDAESFALMKQRSDFKKILRYCDGYLISGEAGCIKPDLTIYEKLCQQFSIDPQQETVVFIDDQHVNVEAAQALGIKGILCKDFDYDSVKKSLRKYGVQI